jgi:hypothetical protein
MGFSVSKKRVRIRARFLLAVNKQYTQKQDNYAGYASR